ncbi:hypothetical protein H0W32_03400 [Patescibacteria group bacterium]|nr:hypothetical protein [Patescibacteria group bacterium]
MNTLTISAKELRLNFSEVMEQLKKGIPFTLIYRSQPVAYITPYEQHVSQEKWPLDEIIGGFHLPKKIAKKLTPEFLDELAEERYEL